MGELIFFDGKDYRRTGIEGIGYANGVNVSMDGKRLYLAATTERHVYVFDRDPKSGTLTFADKVNCYSGVDNIEIDADGSIWIGAHPKTLKFLDHVKGPENLSPSEIIVMKDKRDGNYALETIYLNDGSEISASAVGAPYQDQLLIGPVFQHHFLRAKFK
jgi:arylesterase/paraoxonase